jgi:hypothetical protein
LNEPRAVLGPAGGIFCFCPEMGYRISTIPHIIFTDKLWLKRMANENYHIFVTDHKNIHCYKFFVKDFFERFVLINCVGESPVTKYVQFSSVSQVASVKM